ncbi:MAG: GPR endopeptidase [Clostridia bacterium]|nr:GPR endopeptidase [Clostridia bacterium]
MSIYTDLAFEARELDPELDGVTEERSTENGVEILRTRITGESAAKKLKKAIGSYVTISSARLAERAPELFGAASRALEGVLLDMLPPGDVLVVGLGNRSVTPDSLGSRAADGVFVTRHIVRLMPDALGFPVRAVSVLTPGVLGTTGAETAELVSAAVQKLSPAAVIAIDSLASRRAYRISTVIQVSDAGIDPGSGVGNLRAGLDRTSLGVPVIAIGVPLVVRASTIVGDAVSAALRGEARANAVTQAAVQAAERELEGLIVTPKDVDREAADMAAVICEGVNRALFGGRYEALRSLLS